MSEALTGLAYSLLGFVIGYIIGKAGAEVHEIKEVVSPDHHAAHEARPTKKRGFMNTVTQSRGAGVILIVLALITVLLSTLTAIDLRDQADCRDRYNLRFYQAYVIRAKAADADRASFNAMLYALNDPNLKKRQLAYAKYISDIKQTDAQRKKNPLPYPPNPTGYCQNK